MTREELWEAMVRKYPKFGDTGNVTLKTSGLRKLFDVVWDEAYKSGLQQSVERESSADIPSWFNDILDKRRDGRHW